MIRAASHARHGDARVRWNNLGDKQFPASNSLGFTLTSDGNYHTYRIKLTDSRAWPARLSNCDSTRSARKARASGFASSPSGSRNEPAGQHIGNRREH